MRNNSEIDNYLWFSCWCLCCHILLVPSTVSMSLLYSTSCHLLVLLLFLFMWMILKDKLLLYLICFERKNEQNLGILVNFCSIGKIHNVWGYVLHLLSQGWKFLSGRVNICHVDWSKLSDWKYLDQLSDYSFIKKDPVQWSYHMWNKCWQEIKHMI